MLAEYELAVRCGKCGFSHGKAQIKLFEGKLLFHTETGASLQAQRAPFPGHVPWPWIGAHD